ncbi:MAG: tRNA (N6-threonylcarbamoyladenosine(37)-N6)-methyltransferase TrmO [Deltaproteobacteria bacterium]|nr:tRNA (N6-threonylcarbamoyladenosine(37)-N6)-methyltransferase TrmO [Deltaproteobacteria bacterium]
MTKSAAEQYAIRPIGIVGKKDKRAFVEVYPEYEEALSGLNQFSHIVVLYWFHKNDAPDKRKTLKVHPRGDPSNPLTGVFATRSPVRPNLIGMTICELLFIDGTALYVDRIDALEGTPVIDIKPCISRLDLVSRLRAPQWAEREREKKEND